MQMLSNVSGFKEPGEARGDGRRLTVPSPEGPTRVGLNTGWSYLLAPWLLAQGLTHWSLQIYAKATELGFNLDSHVTESRAPDFPKHAYCPSF